VLEFFGLATSLNDELTANFIVSLPLDIWWEETTQGFQTRGLLRLFRGDLEGGKATVEELLGLTFDGEQPPDTESEIIARLLENMSGNNVAGTRQWRQKAVEKLANQATETDGGISWKITLLAFDRVALRLGLIDISFAPPGSGFFPSQVSVQIQRMGNRIPGHFRRRYSASRVGGWRSRLARGWC